MVSVSLPASLQSTQILFSIYQVLYGGKEGRGLQARYVVLDSDGDRLVPTHSLAPTHTDGTVRTLRPLSRSFFFPGGKPPKASFCWFNPEEACDGGVFTDPQRGKEPLDCIVKKRPAVEVCSLTCRGQQ